MLAASVVPSIGVEVAGTPTMFSESKTVEEYVREYFEDIPVLAEIARCESKFRHFGKNGDIIRGEINRRDVGVMQINEYYHKATALKLGVNIYSLDGNLAYAKQLYEREGTQPWISSVQCWGLENHVAMNR